MPVTCTTCGKTITDTQSARLIGAEVLCGTCVAKAAVEESARSRAGAGKEAAADKSAGHFATATAGSGELASQGTVAPRVFGIISIATGVVGATQVTRVALIVGFFPLLAYVVMLADTTPNLLAIFLRVAFGLTAITMAIATGFTGMVLAMTRKCGYRLPAVGMTIALLDVAGVIFYIVFTACGR